MTDGVIEFRDPRQVALCRSVRQYGGNYCFKQFQVGKSLCDVDQEQEGVGC